MLGTQPLAPVPAPVRDPHCQASLSFSGGSYPAAFPCSPFYFYFHPSGLGIGDRPCWFRGLWKVPVPPFAGGGGDEEGGGCSRPPQESAVTPSVPGADHCVTPVAAGCGEGLASPPPPPWRGFHWTWSPSQEQSKDSLEIPAALSGPGGPQGGASRTPGCCLARQGFLAEGWPLLRAETIIALSRWWVNTRACENTVRLQLRAPVDFGSASPLGIATRKFPPGCPRPHSPGRGGCLPPGRRERAPPGAATEPGARGRGEEGAAGQGLRVRRAVLAGTNTGQGAT